jgi:trk system potassium uptake protein TrkA
MKVVILGAGRRGRMLARHLIQERRNVVILESNPKRVNEIQGKLDCLVILGSGIDPEKLKLAEVETADFFIAVTDSDEVNLVACGIVGSLNRATTTVAAIRNLTYTGSSGLSTSILGINHIVNPEAETARSIHAIINRGIFSDTISFEKSNLILYNIYVAANSSFVNQSVASCRASIGTEFVIAAINREEEGIVPSGNTTVLAGDTLSIVAFDDGKETLFKILGHKRSKPKKIVIVGGSKIALFLLRSFSSSQLKHIALVDQDRDICEQFASLFPNLLVIQSDITDETIFEEERLFNYELLISLTNSDELNVITASYAKSGGVKNTMALIKNNNNYIRLTRHLGIDSIISVSEATVDSLLKYMRGSNVSSVHSMFNGRFEIFEFVIEKKMLVANTRLRDIEMRDRGIIAGITKANGKNIIPDGSYKIEVGDILIVCAGREHLGFVQKVFS